MQTQSTKRSAVSRRLSLGVNRIVGPFACLVAGLVVATGVFLGELLCYGGQKMVGLDPDEPADDVDAPHRDVSVDAPLQAIKAEVEQAEEAAEELVGEQGAEKKVTTLLVEGTVALAEGLGRYERVACLERDVKTVLPGVVPVDHTSVTMDSAVAAACLPEKEVHLGEVLATMLVPMNIFAGHGADGNGGARQGAAGDNEAECQGRYNVIWDDLSTTCPPDNAGVPDAPDVGIVFGSRPNTSVWAASGQAARVPAQSTAIRDAVVKAVETPKNSSHDVSKLQ